MLPRPNHSPLKSLKFYLSTRLNYLKNHWSTDLEASNLWKVSIRAGFLSRAAVATSPCYFILAIHFPAFFAVTLCTSSCSHNSCWSCIWSRPTPTDPSSHSSSDCFSDCCVSIQGKNPTRFSDDPYNSHM